jgi:3-methyladenine DNA glycosylase AlkC
VQRLSSKCAAKRVARGGKRVARGPDGQGGGAGFSLADQLFNAQTLHDLAAELAGLPGFDTHRFHHEATDGLAGRGLLERLDWIATCVERQLPRGFPAMADALEAAMPPPLDPARTDDDFGRFIHAVPGILAVRHGMEDHRERALDLLHAATQRFSMEFYIRPFLDRWPDETLARLQHWVSDDNYHVRRLVSEGTRPRLPWAQNIALDPAVPLRFLDRLHADPTRYVTRSVANHMNDLSKVMPDTVVARLADWRTQAQQTPREMDWLTRHALRTAVKRGEPGALDLLGYRPGIVRARIESLPETVRIGETLHFAVVLEADRALPVLVDYRLRFVRPRGDVEKVFKLKTGQVAPDRPLRLEKRHVLKADATTYRLYPGRHGLVVQANGQDIAEAVFEVLPPEA